VKDIDRVVRDGETGRTWTVGFLGWRPTPNTNYADLRGRMRLGCTPASGNKVYIELPSVLARDDDAILEEIRRAPSP
jgi:hypothetical protein